MNSDEIKSEAFKYAVLNAAQHGGEARSGPVLSKFLAEFPELRANAKELMSIVEEVVEEVNEALGRGMTPYDLLTQGLVAGMDIVGEDFRDGILFVPEVLMAAKAMKAGMAILRAVSCSP